MRRAVVAKYRTKLEVVASRFDAGMGPFTRQTRRFEVETTRGSRSSLHPKAVGKVTYFTATLVGHQVFAITKVLSSRQTAPLPNCCRFDTKRRKWVLLNVEGPGFHLHEAVLVDDSILVFGDDNLPGDGKAHLWKLDLVSLGWTCLDMQPLPVIPVYMVCEFIDDIRKVVYFGSPTKKRDQRQTTLMLIDVDTHTWTIPRESGAGATIRRGHASCSCQTSKGTTVFIFGGRDGQTYLNDLYALHIRNLTCTWSQVLIGPYVEPVAFGSLACVNSSLIVYGGFNRSFDDVGTFLLYDLIDKQWQNPREDLKFKIKGHLSPNSAHRLLPFHDGFLIVGGFNKEFPWIDMLHAVG